MLTAEEVTAEAHALVALRSKITPREIASLRRYAWRRSAFPEPTDRISESAAVWRQLFQAFDQQLATVLDPAQKSQVDVLEIQHSNAALAERMLAYRTSQQPKEPKLGIAVSFLSFIVGLVLGWSFFHAALGALFVGVPIGLIGTLCSAVIIQDTWSTSVSTKWMYPIGRFFPPIRAAAERLINVNVLATEEFNKVGDPARVSTAIKNAQALLQRQDGILGGSFKALEDHLYKNHVRSVEDRLVQTPMPDAQRLSEANNLIRFIDKARNTITSELDVVNDDLDVELLEAQRQVSGLQPSSRRESCENWLALARKVYLHARCATNVLYNRLDFDGCISAGVVASGGKLDFSLPAEELATQAASSYWTPELEQKREQLSKALSEASTALFGALA